MSTSSDRKGTAATMTTFAVSAATATTTDGDIYNDGVMVTAA